MTRLSRKRRRMMTNSQLTARLDRIEKLLGIALGKHPEFLAGLEKENALLRQMCREAGLIPKDA